MKQNRLLFLISVIAALTAAFSLYMIVSTLVTRAREQRAFDELTSAVELAGEEQSAAAFDTGLTAVYGDELITLSTCNYHTDNGRFVVVARKTDR